MLLSLKWLREFVPFEGTAEELGARLTLLGLEMEDLLHPYDGIKDIVIGKVLTCEPHPQSDHLHVCTVDAGTGEVLPIVCGAPNVAAGQTVPVALVGTTMPDGMKIKAAKLRGEASHGMICSERELGLSEEHSGILVLPDTLRAGEKFVDALDLDRDILEIGITPNRADCLSMLGFARETALAFNLPLTLPQVQIEESGADWTHDFAVEIPDPELCQAYRLRLLEGVRIAPSPASIRYRLHAVGVRAISNVVDVTNYILMELGQPLHAFDRDLIEGNKIIVSAAQEGERLVTLDGQERILRAGADLLIRDGVKPVALAGVMGGANTEINAESRNVLIECAIFRPGTIRRTARRLGLSSEASYRYERGVDQVGSVYALERAAALMASLSGGCVRTGVACCEPRPWQAPVINFRKPKAVSLLGIDLDDTFCRDTFTGMGCTVEGQGEQLTVTAPSWRQDLSREADLIEELARVYGMDAIPEKLPFVHRSLDDFGHPESHYDFLLRVKRWGSAAGLNEAENYSFLSHKDLDLLGLPNQDRISILNPLSEEQAVLRTELTPGLLGTVRHNIAHGNTSLRLFEVANAFTLDKTSETTAKESPKLAIALYGPLRAGNWPDAERDADYSDLRGLVEHFITYLDLPMPVCRRDDGSHPYLSPCVVIEVAGESVGVMGRVRPAQADAFHAHKPLWTAELDLTILRKLHDAARVQFKPLAVYPASTRDITVMAPAMLSVNAINDCLAGGDIRFLESFTLVDLFEPEGKDERNLTFRLVFRHPERTLKDAEIDKEREKACALLTSSLGVRI